MPKARVEEERMDCEMPPQEGGGERKQGSTASWKIQEFKMRKETQIGKEKGLN